MENLLTGDMTIEEIMAEINKTIQRDAALQKEIDALLLQRHELEHHLSSLQHAAPLVEAAEASTVDLHGHLKHTSGLVHHIVGQGHGLEVANERLQLVLAHVDCALDLTATRDAVAQLVATQQYEAAAQQTWRVLHHPASPARIGGPLQDDINRLELGNKASKAL